MTAMPEGALPRGSGLPLTATLGALGVMYGDIGTCPLYALKEAAKAAAHCRELTHDAIFGTVSLILWALILFISLKYALLSCARTTAAEAASLFFWHCFRPATQRGTWRAQILIVGLVGSALLYGDSAPSRQRSRY